MRVLRFGVILAAFARLDVDVSAAAVVHIAMDFPATNAAFLAVVIAAQPFAVNDGHWGAAHKLAKGKAWTCGAEFTDCLGYCSNS